MTNPENPSEMRESTVWPVHCVQNTFGAQIIPEINSVKLDVLVKKGMDARVEMYSAFADIFGNKSGATLDLPALLREKAITHVYVVGLAGDHCVRCTALDARKEGFSTFVVQDATRSVDETKGWSTAVKEFKEAGISVIDSTSPEIERIKALSRP
jgi:nicotinamidase-related amidase